MRFLQSKIYDRRFESISIDDRFDFGRWSIRLRPDDRIFRFDPNRIDRSLAPSPTIIIHKRHQTIASKNEIGTEKLSYVPPPQQCKIAGKHKL